MRFRAPLTAALLVALLPSPAAAYHEQIHELFPERALAGEPALKSEQLNAVTEEELAAFRRYVDGLFRAHPDEKVRAEYVRRWPTPESFDSVAFKTLLGLNERRALNGFDKTEGLPGTALQAIQKGSSQPDSDWRNRERLAHGPDGQPLKLVDGREVPLDPLVLNMGNATGLSSQAHAHYGLADVQLSSDADVLKTDPRRFALAAGWPAGPVRTFAREYGQAHYDLAVLAMLSGTPSGRALSRLFFGQSLHYLGDVGNQIHTVQVGFYDFFFTAKMETWGHSLKTLGGYLGELRPFTKVGIDILTNHHVVSEELNHKRLREALAGKPVPEPIQAALAALGQDDAQFKSDLEMALARMVAKEKPEAGGRLPIATLIIGRLIDFSSREGGEVYRHMAGAMHPRMSRYGVTYDPEKEDPDTVLGDLSDPTVKAHLESLYWLQAKAFARVGGAIRLLYARLQKDVEVAEDKRMATAQTFANSLLRERLAELKGQEERLAAYLKDPPPQGAKTVKEPAWLVGPLATPVVLATGVVAVVRRGRRKRDEERAEG
ncbi:MAG: hypothetical protein AB2A00_36070 [Myxococcota bacterium]